MTSVVSVTQFIIGFRQIFNYHRRIIPIKVKTFEDDNCHSAASPPIDREWPSFLPVFRRMTLWESQEGVTDYWPHLTSHILYVPVKPVMLNYDDNPRMHFFSILFRYKKTCIFCPMQCSAMQCRPPPRQHVLPTQCIIDQCSNWSSWNENFTRMQQPIPGF